MSFYYSLNKNRDRDALDSATFTNQAPGPGVFEGESATDIITTPVDAITAGLPAAVGAVSALGLAGASGLSKKAYDYFGMDTMSGAASKAENFWLGQTDEAVTAIKSLRPNPKTQGAALQLFSGVAEVLPRAVFLGPIGAGLVSGIENTTENVQEGKDIPTAAKLGATTGLVEGIGIGLPASLGVSLAGKVASGAAMNVGLGMVERKSKSQILSDAGYHAQAEQYKWNDNTSMLIDGVLGSAFGALPGGGKDTRPAAEQMFGGLGEVITPSLLDKALLANDARHIEELAPGIPTTVEASNAHVKAMDESINALEQGDEVSANVVGYDFLPKTEDYRDPVDVISEAGNKLDGQQYKNLLYEQKDLEYKLKSLDDAANESGYTKQDFIAQAKSENPRVPARKIASIAEQMAINAKANDRADLQSMLDRVNHQIDINKISSDAYSYIDRTKLLTKTNEEITIQPQPKDISQVKIDEPNRESSAIHFDSNVISDIPEVKAAKEMLVNHGDSVIPWENDMGEVEHISASELLTRMDDERMFTDNAEAATQAAINCFLSFGDKL